MKIQFVGRNVSQHDTELKTFEFEVENYRIFPPGSERQICGLKCKTAVWSIRPGPFAPSYELLPSTLQILSPNETWEHYFRPSIEWLSNE